MATERQAPDALLAQTNLTGAVTVIDEDPDSSGTDFLTASGNNVNTDARVSFATPTGAPTTGAGLQEFKIQVREFDTGQTGTPKARIELWENGSLVRAGSDVNVTTQDQVIALTWDATEIATADGSLVECKFVGTKSGGSPTARNTVELGAVEWNVTFSAGTSVDATSVAVSLLGQAATTKVDTSLTTGTPVAVSLSSQVATLKTDTSFTTNTPSISLTTQPSTVKINPQINASSVALIYATQPATVVAISSTVVNAVSSSLALVTQAASVKVDAAVAAAVSALSTITQNAVVKTDVSISAGTVAISVGPLSAVIKVDTSISTGTAAMVYLAKQATVTLDASVANASSWHSVKLVETR